MEGTNSADNSEAKQENVTPPSDSPISLYDKTEAMVNRQEKANKKAEEILNRQESLFANQRLAGTTGGRVEPEVKEVSDTDYVSAVLAGKDPNAKE